MALNTIVEYEGVVIDVRPRYWAAHQTATAALGLAGPPEPEFWRLLRTEAPDAMMVPQARPHQVLEYRRRRDEQINRTDLMALDQAAADAPASLRALKEMGTLHVATFCPNREGINATLDRLVLWMYFDQKRVLPQDRDRRVAALREMADGNHMTLAVAGTVAFAYAAGEAGCRVVGMNTGLAFPKLMRQVGVDLFFDSLDALTSALTQRDPALQRIGISL
jgi:phosphoglycolate phosphatase-like HAD superfamily hydrolase